MIERLLANGITFEDSVPEAADSALAGKTFVITGTFSRSRDELTAALQQRGAKVTGSVSKNTDYVAVGESPGSKADKASQLGIPTLDEAGLMAMLEAPDSR